MDKKLNYLILFVTDMYFKKKYIELNFRFLI